MAVMEQALATLVTWKGVAVFLWLAAFFVGERLRPAAREPRGESVLIFETLVLAAAPFHHSNFRLHAGFERLMSRLFITPSIHWGHHHARQRDTDSNYGTIFSFWDPVFSTRSASRRTPDMAIGVERRAERPFVQLVLRPFLNRTARDEASPGTSV